MVKLTKLDKSFIIRNNKIIINKDENYINTIRQVIKTNKFSIFDQKTITY